GGSAALPASAHRDASGVVRVDRVREAALRSNENVNRSQFNNNDRTITQGHRPPQVLQKLKNNQWGAFIISTLFPPCLCGCTVALMRAPRCVPRATPFGISSLADPRLGSRAPSQC